MLTYAGERGDRHRSVAALSDGSETSWGSGRVGCGGGGIEFARELPLGRHDSHRPPSRHKLKASYTSSLRPHTLVALGRIPHTYMFLCVSECVCVCMCVRVCVCVIIYTYIYYTHPHTHTPTYTFTGQERDACARNRLLDNSCCAASYDQHITVLLLRTTRTQADEFAQYK